MRLALFRRSNTRQHRRHHALPEKPPNRCRLAITGRIGPDSDYDLLLIVPDDAPPERKRSRLAYERLWGTGAAVDVLVWTKSGFDRRLHLPASLPATIIREGKLLHAA